jgi:hypothetical protein
MTLKAWRCFAKKIWREQGNTAEGVAETGGAAAQRLRWNSSWLMNHERNRRYATLLASVATLCHVDDSAARMAAMRSLGDLT